MQRRALLFAATWPFASIDGYAQPPFEYRELERCARTRATEESLQVRRVAQGLVVLADVKLLCSQDVKVSVEDGKIIYVNVESVLEPGHRPMCDCMRSLEITLKWKVPAGTTIWLLGNGRGAARAIAK